MQVRQFPCVPGPAAWNALLPVVSARETLKHSVTADWLVIGAGITGLSAARDCQNCIRMMALKVIQMVCFHPALQ